MAAQDGKNASTRQHSAAARGKSDDSKVAAERGEAVEKNVIGKQEDAGMTTQDDSLLYERKRTYEGFIKLSVFSAATIAVILILMAIFLL